MFGSMSQNEDQLEELNIFGFRRLIVCAPLILDNTSYSHIFKFTDVFLKVYLLVFYRITIELYKAGE